MRIISDFKDCYDPLAYRWFDESTIYDRRLTYGEKLIHSEKYSKDTVSLAPPYVQCRSVKNRLPERSYIKFVSIVGKVFAYNEKTYKLLTEEDEPFQRIRFNRWSRGSPEKFEQGIFRKAVAMIHYEKLFVPVFEYVYDSYEYGYNRYGGFNSEKVLGFIEKKVPVLDNIKGLLKIISPEDIYREIYTFLNLLKKPKKLVNISDEKKLEKHGFDSKILRVFT